MSFKAWRVKVSICQTDPADPTCRPELTSPPRAPSPVKDGTSPLPDRSKTAAVYPKVKQLLMDLGVPTNPKVSKPSLGVRVLRTLFDNSPPTYTSAKSQASAAAAAARAKEQQRLQELQDAQERAQAYGQVYAQQGQKNVKNRPPTPKNLSGEVARGQSDSSINVISSSIDRLADKSGRLPPGLKKGGRGNASHFSSRSSLVSNDNRSSFGSFDDADSSVSTDSEYDSSSFYRNTSYHEHEVHKMNRSAVQDLGEDYDLGCGHVDDDSLVPGAQKESNSGSAERLEYMEQEIERLRLENLVLRQRGSINKSYYDNDLASRTSSTTEVSNAAEDAAAKEWIPYADYAPPGVTSASVASVRAQQTAHRRGEMPRHPGDPEGRYFPGEHAARVVSGGGSVGGGHAHGSSSASEAVSMVTDGSRASSRHNSGLLADLEPHSGLTSRHNSGFQSDQEENPSIMSWDGSRHNSGPMLVDRQELYGLTNHNKNSNSSRNNSRNNSGMLLVDSEELLRGGARGSSRSATPLGGNSRENSRHNSGMQVDREGRNLPPGLASPRISFEGSSNLPMNSNMPAAAVSTPHSFNSTIKTVQETFTSHRFVTSEQHLAEPEAWNNIPSDRNGNKYIEEYDACTNQRSHDHVEAPSRTSTPPPAPPAVGTQWRNHETYEAPSRTTTSPPDFGDYNDTECAFGSQHSNTTPSVRAQPPRRTPTPPISRDSSHGLDSTHSSMFSYPTPSIITVPRSRSAHNQLDTEDLSQLLQHHHSLSMDHFPIVSVPRSRSTHSQMSTEDSLAGTPPSSAASQHQSTLERLMISQQRRQNMSSNPMSVNASPDQQYSRQPHTKSPHRR